MLLLTRKPRSRWGKVGTEGKKFKGSGGSVHFHLKKGSEAGLWWLTHIILATQEAEIRIMVQS
jgi:hypothetical protein